MGVTIRSLIRLKTSPMLNKMESMPGPANLANYSVLAKVLVIGEESRTINLLNQAHSLNIYKHLSLSLQVSVVFTLPSRKAPFATDGDHHGKTPQPIKMRGCGLQSLWIHLQNTPSCKPEGALWKREQTDCKSQGV